MMLGNTWVCLFWLLNNSTKAQQACSSTFKIENALMLASNAVELSGYLGSTFMASASWLRASDVWAQAECSYRTILKFFIDTYPPNPAVSIIDTIHS